MNYPNYDLLCDALSLLEEYREGGDSDITLEDCYDETIHNSDHVVTYNEPMFAQCIDDTVNDMYNLLPSVPKEVLSVIVNLFPNYFKLYAPNDYTKELYVPYDNRFIGLILGRLGWDDDDLEALKCERISQRPSNSMYCYAEDKRFIKVVAKILSDNVDSSEGSFNLHYVNGEKVKPGDPFVAVSKKGELLTVDSVSISYNSDGTYDNAHLFCGDTGYAIAGCEPCIPANNNVRTAWNTASDGFECSNCGTHFKLDGIHYCPNCGCRIV